MHTFIRAFVASVCFLIGLNSEAATIRDNYVSFFLPASTKATASFSTNAHSITSGQPWGGVSSASGSLNHTQLLVKAGRKKNSPVANWFNTQAQGGIGLEVNDFKNRPSELNFAAQGTITFTVDGTPVTCQNFIIAQGSFSSTNNWWLTAPSMTLVSQTPTIKKTSLQCTRNSAAMAELLKPAANRVASFKIGPAYDTVNVGLTADQTKFDYMLHTTDCGSWDSGDSRCGHEYGTALSEKDKKALLEYLKIL